MTNTISVNRTIPAAQTAAEEAILRQRAQERLEQSAENPMLLDTCALLNARFPALAERLRPILKQSGRALVVPTSVIRELEYLAMAKAELTEQIQAAFSLMAGLRAEGLLKVYGDTAAGRKKNLAAAAAGAFPNGGTVLVITQDNSLSDSLLRQETGTWQGRLQPCRINRHGYLSRYQTPERRAASLSRTGVWPRQTVPAPETVKAAWPTATAPSSGRCPSGTIHPAAPAARPSARPCGNTTASCTAASVPAPQSSRKASATDTAAQCLRWAGRQGARLLRHLKGVLAIIGRNAGHCWRELRAYAAQGSTV